MKVYIVAIRREPNLLNKKFDSVWSTKELANQRIDELIQLDTQQGISLTVHELDKLTLSCPSQN